MKLSPKFTVGDKAWCAVRYDEFKHDDRLPIAEVEVTKVNFSGTFYGEGNQDNTQEFSYDARESDSWFEVFLRETELFSTKAEAEQAAIEKLNKSLSANEKNIEKIHQMLGAAQ